MADRSGLGNGRSRRKVLLGAAAAGTAAIGAPIAATRLIGVDHHDPPKAPPRSKQHASESAADAGGFADRDSSYAATTKTKADTDLGLFKTASDAARRTKVTVPTILDTSDPVLHLVRRTTPGATPEILADARNRGIDGWIERQLDPKSIDDSGADAIWAQWPLASKDPAGVAASIERYHWDAMYAYGEATLARQIWTRRHLYEVMVDFWANHLNIETPSGDVWDTVPAWHNDVIRGHALGSFTDMLVAGMRHPAMLRYLSNDKSHKESVNENLGRELLELHTVGVASGFTETDVRNSAYLLTGRTVLNTDDQDKRADFWYDPERHWTGAVKVLGFTHPNADANAGLDVGDAYLRYLAAHPATALSIARKLAVRFVADNPPAPLVQRLAKAYLDHKTEIVPVLDILFRSGEFWAAVGQKSRRPLENLVAAARVLGLKPGGNTTEGIKGLCWATQEMGHRPLGWHAPNGYPDVREAWRSSGPLIFSWNFHRGLIQGWWDGVTYPDPAGLIGNRPQGSLTEYVDSLCELLTLQRFQPAHRDALVVFAGGAKLKDRVGELVPLILDSPYFSLR